MLASVLILPLTYRAKGVSIATATNWAFNWLVGEGTPYLQELLQWKLYPLFGCFCVCSFILVYFTFPETMGVPLEEMDSVFGETHNVLRSRALANTNHRAIKLRCRLME